MTNEDAAAMVTQEKCMLKAAEEGRDSDVLVLIQFTFPFDLKDPLVWVRLNLHGSGAGICSVQCTLCIC